MTVGVDLDITATGRQIAGQPHPDTGLGAHQTDRPGVHPAQCRAVDGQFRFGAAVVSQGGGVQGLRVDIVTTGNDIEALGVQFGVDLRAAGDDVELVNVVGIQPHAIDGNTSALNVETLQLAIGVQHRLAGGQRDLRGVDEAATVATDAVGVGDDDSRRLPRHFRITLELAGVGPDHFVENGGSGRATQVGVANDDPAQLSVLGLVGGVVEDDALAFDVELLILVVRQAAGIGRGNVDDRHAIAGLAQAGVRPTDHNAFGLNQQRLPEHRVGKNQREAALGHSPERPAFGQHSRRLTSKQGQLVNVHVNDLETVGLETTLLKEEVHTEIDRRFALDHIGTFQGASEGHRGGNVLATGKQFERVAGQATMLVAVVTVIADHALVVTSRRAIFGKHRAQPVERHRAGQAYFVAPIAAAVAGQKLILVATH